MFALVLLLGIILELVDAAEKEKDMNEKGMNEKGTKEKKKPKKMKDEEMDEDDEEGDADKLGELEDEEEMSSGRKDCVDDRELQICSDECEGHPDCKRQANNMECEEECQKECRYIEKNKAIKCVINLTAGVNRYRDRDRRGSRGSRRD